MAHRVWDGEEGVTLVELLIVMVLTAVIGAATLTVLVTTSRSNTYGDELRTVMDDGRVSIDRVRKELRGGRRVLDGSDRYHLYWWVDQNQNGQQETSERIHYCVTPLGDPNGNNCLTSTPAAPDKYQLVRWSDGDGAAAARSIARTLTNPEVFTGYQAQVRETDTVNIRFVLDVRDHSRGPQDITMTASVRLRNVAY